MLSSALFGVALTFACASAAAPGGGSWNILVGVDATDPKSKGPVPGHYDMISTENWIACETAAGAKNITIWTWNAHSKHCYL
eukprot:gene18732-15755_t